MVTDQIDPIKAALMAIGVLFAYGFCPGVFLRLIVLLYHRDDPRREELVAELYVVPRRERPVWVVEQLEVALFEGLRKRLVWMATGRLFDRWRLGSGVAMNRKYPTSFWIPDYQEKQAIVPGVHVRLIFEMTMMRGGESWGERMWVEVDKIGRRRLVGTLLNDPVGIPRLDAGDKVKFSRDDIIDIIWESHSAAAAQDDGGGLAQLHAACNGHLDGHECEHIGTECSDISHP
jgi:hypothetical protein